MRLKYAPFWAWRAENQGITAPKRHLSLYVYAFRFNQQALLINNCCEESGVRSQESGGKKGGMLMKYWIIVLIISVFLWYCRYPESLNFIITDPSAIRGSPGGEHDIIHQFFAPTPYSLLPTPYSLLHKRGGDAWYIPNRFYTVIAFHSMQT